MSIDISARFSGLTLSSCLFNASGPRCTSSGELLELYNSKAGAVLSKSATPGFRVGNPKPRYFENQFGSLNSMGLPNEGIESYISIAAQLSNKAYIVSIAGLSKSDNMQMLRRLQKSGQAVDAVELNLSCPNVPGKAQIGYDFDSTKALLEEVFQVFDGKLGVKLPPYFDMIHFEQMAAILKAFPIAFVTCVNSIGNALIVDAESESVVIRPKSGFGGLGGDYLKPTGLANVRQFYKRLPGIPVIGVGGVKTGLDAFEYILCGATAIQVGSQLMREGIDCFERIAFELKTLMKTKGYKKLSQFRGKLKDG